MPRTSINWVKNVRPPSQRRFSLRVYIKNFRQDLTLLPAYIMLTANGILLNLNRIPNLVEKTEKWNHHVSFSYYSGLFIGTIAASILLHTASKCDHYWFAGITGLGSSLLLMCEYITYNAFFINGLSMGILFITVLIHASEITIQELRGSKIFGIQMSIDFGILPYLLIYSYPHQAHHNTDSDYFKFRTNAGYVMLFITSISLFLLIILEIYESPHFLMANQNHELAEISIMKLHREQQVTNYIEIELNHINNYILTTIPWLRNFNAFIRIFVIRSAYIFASSIHVNLALILITTRVKALYNIGFWFVLCRILGNFIGFINIDRVGRRCTVIVSLLCSGCILIIVTILDQMHFTNPRVNYVLCAMVLMYAAFVGIGSGGVSLTLMTEGFSHSNKTYWIASLILIEVFVQNLLMLPYSFYILTDITFLYGSGVLQIFAGIFSYIYLTETTCYSVTETNLLLSQNYFQKKKK